MKVKALCNVTYGADLHGCGDVFEINAEDAPGLEGAVEIIEEPAKKAEAKEPETVEPVTEEPKAEEPKTRRTRKTTRKT